MSDLPQGRGGGPGAVYANHAGTDYILEFETDPEWISVTQAIMTEHHGVQTVPAEGSRWEWHGLVSIDLRAVEVVRPHGRNGEWTAVDTMGGKTHKIRFEYALFVAIWRQARRAR